MIDMNYTTIEKDKQVRLTKLSVFVVLEYVLGLTDASSNRIENFLYYTVKTTDLNLNDYLSVEELVKYMGAYADYYSECMSGIN